MRKGLTLTLLLLLVGVIPTTAVILAESHRIELIRPGVVEGTELKAGRYRLVLNGDDTAEVYRGRELLLKARVDVMPLGDRTPNSISLDQTGKLREIRLKKERVVFVETQASARTSR